MQVVPIEKSAKGASKPRSGGGNNNTQGMALDSTGQTAKAAKAIPLIQQLESLKNAGTDAFLKSVVIEQPPSSASNRKKGTPNIGGLSLAMNSTYSAPPSASSGPMEPSKPNQTKRSNAPAGRSHRILKAQNQIESDAGSLNAIQESSIGSSSSVPGTSNNFYVDNDDLSATSQADGFPENDNMMNKIKISIDIPPQDGNTKDPATNSKKVTILATTPGAESNNEQGNNNNNNSGGKSPHKQSRSPRGGNKSAPGKPTKYSNAKIDSTNVDTSKITLETQETIEEMKRTKAILAVSLAITSCIFCINL